MIYLLAYWAAICWTIGVLITEGGRWGADRFIEITFAPITYTFVAIKGLAAFTLVIFRKYT